MKLTPVLINRRNQDRKAERVNEIDDGNNPEAAIHEVRGREIGASGEAASQSSACCPAPLLLSTIDRPLWFRSHMLGRTKYQTQSSTHPNIARLDERDPALAIDRSKLLNIE